jgi:hypothetical protein
MQKHPGLSPFSLRFAVTKKIKQYIIIIPRHSVQLRIKYQEKERNMAAHGMKLLSMRNSKRREASYLLEQ